MHELTITRLIAAPPPTVFRVWTERTAEWFAPRPYTTPHVRLELKPGGCFNTTMRSPDGQDMPGEGVILDVEPGRRIVFTNAFKAGWEPQDPFMVVIVTFAPEGAGTRYDVSVRHWNEEARARHEAMGFHAGWGAAAGQLAEIAEAEADTGETP